MVLAELTDAEHADAMRWWNEHAAQCDWASGTRYPGAIGGVLVWEIVPTTIGTLINIRCQCGERHLASGPPMITRSTRPS